MGVLLAAADTAGSVPVLQYVIIGLVTGALYALIALGYTMVYGIVELINFAHGDLFMLGSFLALQLASIGAIVAMGPAAAVPLMLLAVPIFCATLNVGVDQFVYRPLRHAPKLAPLVSAIGVSFIFMNVGLFWFGPVDQNVPSIVGSANLTEGTGIRFTSKDLMVIAITVPTMLALTAFVRLAPLGKAMRATAQNPTAAALMGINVDRVIATTFAIGGALAGVAGVVYGQYFNTVGYQIGFQNGLYAFTAAVLGGIGNIPGAVLGGLVIGLVRSLGSAYVGEQWSEALIFAILIVILIFRPTGLLGSRTREKV